LKNRAKLREQHGGDHENHFKPAPSFTYLGQKLKLRLLTEKLLIISLRFFGIPPFRFYALAEGCRKVLSQGRPPTCCAPPPDTWPVQLFLAWHGQKNEGTPRTNPLTNSNL
jgi:hypothetical protein